MLCKYKDILGVPKQGIHQHVFGVAIVDVVMTLVGAFFISRIFKTSFVFTSMGLFLLGIFLHRLFCVRTSIDKLFYN